MFARSRMLLALLLFSAGMPVGAAEGPAVPGVTAPQAAPVEARSVILSYRFQTGDAHAYRLSVEGKGTATTGNAGLALPVSMAMEMSLQQKVLRVRDDGAAEMDNTIAMKRVLVNEMEVPGTLPALPSMMMVITPSGKLLEVRQNKAPAGQKLPGLDMAGLAAITQRLAFPERPVKVGESWSIKTPDGKQGEYEATTTLVGIEEVAGVEVARLKQTFSMPTVMTMPSPVGGTMDLKGKQAGDLDIRFDVKAGKVTGISGAVDTAVAVLMGGRMNVDVLMKLDVKMDAATTAEETAPPAL